METELMKEDEFRAIMIRYIPREKMMKDLLDAIEALGLTPNSKVRYGDGSGGPKAVTTVRHSSGVLLHVALWDGSGWGSDFSDLPNEFHVWGTKVRFKRGPDLKSLLESVQVAVDLR